MRKKIIAGNWKMNKTPSETIKFIEDLKPLLKNEDADIVLCVPAICIPNAKKAVEGTNIKIGAQNMYFKEPGAYTGETSPEMLVDAGVEYIIVGHSERREFFSETDDKVNKKVLRALKFNITPIICCGETLEQRELGVTLDHIRIQIKYALRDVTAEQAKRIVIAYEPIWAIGTGKVASTAQAEEACYTIRKCIEEIYDAETAEQIRIQYGGSVSAKNAPDLLVQPNIDGGLVGGASLTLDFAEIVNYNMK